MKKRFRSCFTIIIIILCLSLFTTGCGISLWHRESSSTKGMSASFSLFSDTIEKAIELKSGETITIDYDIEIKSGTFEIKIKDPTGNEVMKLDPNSQGRNDLKIDKDGTYTVFIKGNKARGNYKIEWKIR